MKVIAREVAMVTLVGNFNTTSMIGTNKNDPAAPTIPEETPTINDKVEAINHISTLKKRLKIKFGFHQKVSSACVATYSLPFT